MRKTLLTAIVLSIQIHFAFAQLANWSGYKSTKFPTNRSGQIHGNARISQLKFHPTNPLKYYAVTSEGGLFLSNDGGENWSVSPGSDVLTASMASICIDYSNDQVLYLGSGDPNYYGGGAGLYKSTNGGNTFTQLGGGLPTNKMIIETILHPTNPNIIVVATDGGIYKSTDAGATWVAKTATNVQFSDMKKSQGASSLVLFAGTYTNAPELYRSADFGETWTIVTSGITVPTVANIQAGSRIAVTPANANVVYFAMVSSGGMVFKSTDNGLNFTLMKAGGAPYISYYNDSPTESSQGNYNFSIGVDGLDANKIWVQSHCTWYSANSGTTWTKQTNWWEKVHTDMHQICKSPYDNTKLYSCNDGGVWLSTDEGNNWTPKSDGIFAFEVYGNSGKSSPTRRDFVSIGTQDNGELYADSTGWNTNRGGDWTSSLEIDKRANSNMLYYGENGQRRTPLGGQASYNLPTASWQAMAFNRSNIDLAFAGSSNIYRSTNVLTGSPSWTQISTFNKTIKSVHSCIADPNRLYVLTSDQKIYVSTNALGASPTFTMYALPTASNAMATVTAICTNADIVYISINNKVYRSTNGGQTWTDITYNLPSVNHRRILAEEYYGLEELVFIATSNAVYYKKAGQTSWTNYSTNLPSRRSPTELSIFDDGSSQALIRYTSYGRGVWETPFTNLRPLQAIFEASTSSPCIKNVYKFKNTSTGAPVSYAWSFPGGSPSSSTSANPTVTFPAIGTYPVTLVVTDASSNTSTVTSNIVITSLNPCLPDSVPGNALLMTSSSDYVSIPALGITTNTITMSAWIKPNGVQSDYTGLIFSSSNGATGINFVTGNRLGYTWNDEPGSYNYASGPIVPAGVWSHVALVVNATSATFYLNGKATTRTAAHTAVNFNQVFQLGKDRGYDTRNFFGNMDEVCFYNRALTANEIRELMHLTKNQTPVDAGLIRYYQFNESNGIVLEHAGGVHHASLEANATRVTSTAPVGGGVFERQSVTTGGLKSFLTPGVEITFPSSGTFPAGDVVVTRLNVSPDQKPDVTTVPTTGYFIINNFGTNATISALTSIKFNKLPNISSGYSVGDFNFYKRSSTADGNTWGSPVDQADAFTPSGQVSTVTFSTGNGLTSFGQFVLTPFYYTAGADVMICNGASTTLGRAGSSGTTYAWTPSTGLSSASVANPVASPTVTTTYSVTSTQNATGATFTDAVVVSVVPTTVSVSPATPSICPGASVNLVASGGVGLAGGTVQLGSGTSVTSGSSTTSALGPNPLQNKYGGSKQLMLFTAAELTSLGMSSGSSISSIAFQLAAANATRVLQNLQIKAQHSNLTALSTFVTSGWTVVRTAANFTPAVGWNTIAFNSNFVWNGTSNLIVEVNYSNANTGTTSNNTANFTTTSNVSTLFYRVNNASAATINSYSGTPSYSYSSRNNTRFAYTNPSTYTWTPSTGLSATTGTSVTANPTSATTYTVTATTMGCSTSASVTVAMQTYAIVATAGTGGTISPAGTTNVVCASNRSYTITPNSGYAIQNVLVDGVSQGAISSYTFNNVTAAHTIQATFAVTCVNPGVPTLSASSTTNCGTTSTTLNIASGALNGAANWNWYSGSCGTSFAGTGTSISVSPSSTTTYYARGEGGCASPGACGSITITVNPQLTWYQDVDNDGHYTSTQTSCTSPGAGWTSTLPSGGNTDCAPSDNTKWQTLNGFVDADNDGYTVGAQVGVCSGAALPSGYKATSLGLDCNDANPSINPSVADSNCNGIDENCSGSSDENYTPSGCIICSNGNLVSTAVTWYLDEDNDSYYTNTQSACNSPGLGWTSTLPVGGNSDCAPLDASKHAQFNFYADADNDGFGAGNTQSVCAVDAETPPSGYSTSNTDCAPADPMLWQTISAYADADGDGFTVGALTGVCSGASIPSGYTTTSLGLDCNDANAAINPNATDSECNGIDENCSGAPDEDAFPTCITDCNGTYGGSAYLDNCATCVGGTTGLSACVQDCNGTYGGSAFVDNCATCVGGTTGLSACVQDCQGVYGGTAFVDNCATCVGGTTGLSATNPIVWYLDADADSYYTATQSACNSPGIGWTSTLPTGGSSDCAPTDNTKWQLLNGFVDGDDDGYTIGNVVSVCSGANLPNGYKATSLGTDCNDANPSINPAATEILYNSIDENCNGLGDDAPCASPSGAVASSITGSSATFTWGAVSGSNQYEFRYRVVGAATWITTVVSSPTVSITISTLSASTNYEWNVRSQCGGIVWGNYNSTSTFTTTAVCPAPIGRFTSNITSTSAKLNWTGFVGPSNYQVRYRRTGTTAWTTITMSTTAVFRNITGLIAATAYQWNVRSRCNGTYGAWSTTNATFTTLGAVRLADADTSSPWVFSIHPNPSNGQFTITPQAEMDGVAQVQLIDIAGRVVLQQTWNAKENATLVLNKQLDHGVYVLTISANGYQFSERVVVNGN